MCLRSVTRIPFYLYTTKIKREKNNAVFTPRTGNQTFEHFSTKKTKKLPQIILLIYPPLVHSSPVVTLCSLGFSKSFLLFSNAANGWVQIFYQIMNFCKKIIFIKGSSIGTIYGNLPIS